MLGRRREKDFLSTWALLEGQVLATCDDASLPEAPSTRAVMVTRGRTAAARRRSSAKATQLRSTHFRVADWSGAWHRKMPSQRAHNRRCSAPALTNAQARPPSTPLSCALFSMYAALSEFHSEFACWTRIQCIPVIRSLLFHQGLSLDFCAHNLATDASQSHRHRQGGRHATRDEIATIIVSHVLAG